ncbi:acyl-CoA N-acyltransferase [Schizophyllum commune]
MPRDRACVLRPPLSPPPTSPTPPAMASAIFYRQYAGEEDLPHIMALVQSELSEPYVIYTFRYFLHQWPHLAFLAYPAADASVPVGVIVCKQSMHKMNNRGYIAMLSVDKQYRKRGIAASTLVRNSISAMKKDGVEEVVLETEYDNTAALSLYESLGFIREKRLYRFYLNGKDAFRLVHIVPAGRGKGPSGGAGMDIPGSRSDDSSDTASDSSYEADRARGRRIGYPYRAIRVSEPYDSEDEVSYR